MDMTNETNRKAPPKGLMKVLSFFGLFILVAFPAGMLFAGFSTLEVSCTRNLAGQLPDCEIREERLFGLFQRRAIVSGVTGVGYNTRNISTGSRAILGSTVVLSGSNGSFPVSRATSNVGSDWKSDLIVKVERFLNSSNEQTLALHINERNLFGWIGAACVAFIAYCYVSWFVRKLTGRP